VNVLLTNSYLQEVAPIANISVLDAATKLCVTNVSLLLFSPKESVAVLLVHSTTEPFANHVELDATIARMQHTV
jgi:hypothetical protein